MVIEGREALAVQIGGFHGARVVATSGIDAYDGRLRFAGRLLDADGVVTLEGIDFGELAPDGGSSASWSSSDRFQRQVAPTFVPLK